jgi:hypothetical protein
VEVGAVHYLGDGDMTTMKYRVTSMKEEELSSVLVIEPPSISDEVVIIIEEGELLSDFSNHGEDEAIILSRRASAGAESQFQKEQLQRE